MSDIATVLADMLPAPAAAPSTDAKAPEAAPAPAEEAKAPEGQTQEDSKADATEPKAEKAEEPEAEDDNGEDDQPKSKRKPGSAKLREEVAELRAEVARYRQKEAAPAQAGADLQAAIERELGPPPKREDFTSYLEFDAENVAYKAAAKQVERELKHSAAAAQHATEIAFQAKVEAFNELEDEARKKLPDYDERMSKAVNIKTEPHVDALILNSDKGALLKYHLAERPQEVERLNRMPPLEAARRIGQIEARLSFAKPQTETKAPPPITPVTGGAAPPSSDPMAALEAWGKKTYGNRFK